MRAIVTGSCGFVGRHLIQLLRDAGYEVIGIDPKNEDINHRKCRFEWWVKSCFPEVWEPYDVFIHLAANIQSIDEREKGDLLKYADITLDYCAFDFVRKNPPRKALIYPSSCAIDAAETDAYAYSKTVGERMAMALHRQGIPTVILRPFSGYGEDQAESYPFPALLSRVMNCKDEVKIWGSTDTVRDWLHISDLAQAFIWAIDNAPRGIPIDIGTGIGRPMWELVTLMLLVKHKLTGNKDTAILPRIVADYTKPTSSRRRVADTTLAKAHGFEAKVTLQEGINHAIAYRLRREAALKSQ